MTRSLLKKVVQITLLTVLALLVTTTSAWAKPSLKVVTSTSDLAAIVAAVGGERVEVTSLAKPTEDPHYVDPRPSHALKLNKADLLVVNGLQLEIGWLPGLIVQARNEAIQQGSQGYLDASTVVELLQVPTQAIDRSQGDVHPGGNPHYTPDPRRGKVIARALSKRLAALDPKGKSYYEGRLGELEEALDEVSERYQKKFAALPAEKRRVVTYHASTIYISDWLGLKELIQVEPKPGISPNPKHIARVLTTMREQGARVIFQESFYPSKASAQLAELAKGEVVLIAGGTDITSGESYVQRVEKMAQAIYAAVSR